MTPGTRSRGFVDELEAVALQPGEGLREVRHTICNVVEGRAPLLQESADRGVRAQWLQELDGPDEQNPNPLGSELLNGGTPISAQEFEEWVGLLQ